MMCSVAGIKKKTAHFARVTCVTTLFNAGVDEVNPATGHRSNDLQIFNMRRLTENKWLKFPQF